MRSHCSSLSRIIRHCYPIGSKYLPDSLGHIYSQTRPADRVVVTDDGSTDGSWGIIQKFAREHSNLHAHANLQKVGLEASIGAALQLIDCDYLVCAGADDRLLPPFLERNMTVLARYRAAALSFSEVVARSLCNQYQSGTAHF
jgi:glycosyltransferase involved in cell wall biosynthesis